MAEFLHENAGRLLAVAAFVIYAFSAWYSLSRALGASKTRRCRRHGGESQPRFITSAIPV
jgi:hypothetical protein